MVSTQPDRDDRARAWSTGACNRGFVSLDPERQPEAICDERRRGPKVPKRDQFAFMVQQLAEAARRPRERADSAAADAGAETQREEEPKAR